MDHFCFLIIWLGLVISANPWYRFCLRSINDILRAVGIYSLIKSWLTDSSCETAWDWLQGLIAALLLGIFDSGIFDSTIWFVYFISNPLSKCFIKRLIMLDSYGIDSQKVLKSWIGDQFYTYRPSRKWYLNSVCYLFCKSLSRYSVIYTIIAASIVFLALSRHY